LGVHSLGNLLSEGISGCHVAVPLAVNGGLAAASDGVHLPLGEVVVDDVDVAPPAARHSLDQLLPEVVEGDGYLHAGVWEVVVAVAQKHDLVVVG